MGIKRAKIFFGKKFAGHLDKRDGEYFFEYDGAYLNDPNSVPVSVTLPLQKDAFRSEKLFPFFRGLIPEGWLFELNSRALKIDRSDEFEMLLHTGADCVGAVRVIGEEEHR